MIIYKITNVITDKIYVGKTIKPIQKRFKEHLTGRGGAAKLYNSILKHGKDNFIIEEIDEANSETELSQKETYWIGTLDSISNGYNLTDASIPDVNRLRWDAASDEDRKRIGEFMKKGWENKDRSKVVKENWDAMTDDERKQKSRGIAGSWDSLSTEERSERAREASLAALEKSKAFVYLFIDPAGNEYVFKGLGVFCSNNGLDKNSMKKISEGKLIEYNGWKCYRIIDGSVFVPKPFVKKKPGPKPNAKNP